MNSNYINLWQNSIADVFDNKKHLETMDRFMGQALSSFEELSTLMQTSPHWDLVGKSFSMFTPFYGDLFDVKKSINDTMKMMGLVTLDEYRSLVKKYDELKKERTRLEKADAEQKSKIDELKQSIAKHNKTKSSTKKSLDTKKSELDEQKKENSKLKKELESTQKLSKEKEKELEEAQKAIETLKKDLEQLKKQSKA